VSGELEKTKSYNKSKIIKILSEDDPSALLAEADEARRNYIGDEVYLRGIIEFSNYCIQDCHYCGLGCNNNKLERYRMSDDEILAVARDILNSGIGTVVLQSGVDTFYSTQ